MSLPTASFIDTEQARELTAQHGTPLFVYAKERLRNRAAALLALRLPFGLTVRYAMKANPHPGIVGLLADAGLHFDASSSYEAAALLQQGIAGDKISLSSQQPAHNLPELLRAGVHYIATSLHQLELAAADVPRGGHVGLRVNPGMPGQGHNNRTSTGGVNSSFGLWHEYLEDAERLAQAHQMHIDRLHVHIGSGADPAAWAVAIGLALDLAERMPDVTVLDMGGGFKVARAFGEPETDMQQVGVLFAQAIQAFAARTGRQLHLEIEPGSWLVAHAGVLLAEVVDIVDTGAAGYTFLRTNTGMNDIIRPSMYGAQHHIAVLNNATEEAEYIVVGHNCETGDILTPAPHDPEGLLPRRLSNATIGDILAIADAGAYCASFSAKGYNHFPSARELLV